MFIKNAVKNKTKEKKIKFYDDTIKRNDRIDSKQLELTVLFFFVFFLQKKKKNFVKQSGPIIFDKSSSNLILNGPLNIFDKIFKQKIISF